MRPHHISAWEEKRTRKSENFFLTPFRSLTGCISSQLFASEDITCLRKTANKQQSESCYMLCPNYRHTIRYIIWKRKKKKNECSHSWEHKLCCFSDLASVLKKKGDNLEGLRGFCGLLQKSMNAQGSGKPVKDLPWKDAINGGSLLVKLGLFIFNFTSSFC